MIEVDNEGEGVSEPAPVPSNFVGFLQGPTYLQQPRSPDTWLVQGVLPVGGSINVYGPQKAGKSFATLQLAAAVANPDVDTWLSLPIVKHGKVCYFQVDTPRGLWMERIESVQKLGVDLSRVWFQDRAACPYPFDILNPEHYGWLERACLDVGPDLVLIDVIREIHEGDENESAQMKRVMNQLIDATKPAALCIISHARKENMNIPAKDRGSLMGDNRGSNYLAGAVDCVMKITPNQLVFKGRAVEQTIIRMHQGDGGLWHVENIEVDRAIEQVMKDDHLKTDRARARRLSELTAKPVEACRHLIRRAA